MVQGDVGGGKPWEASSHRRNQFLLFLADKPARAALYTGELA